MRTTVEITPHQHEALLTIARRRGIRGFSPLVQEALDAYISDLRAEEVEFLLSLESSIDENDAQTMRRRIEDARSRWRAS